MTQDHAQFPHLAFEYGTGLGAPTRAECLRLRQLRGVSHAFRESVDMRLMDETWKHAFNVRAAAFVQGPPPVLPADVTAVGRMIDAVQYDVLAAGMQEFAMHEETQGIILAELRTALSPAAPPNPGVLAGKIRVASKDGLVHRAVAQSIRFHLVNAIIVQDGCYVLSALTRPNAMTQQLKDYIIFTLVEVMQGGMADLEVRCSCLQAILTLVMPRQGFETISFGAHNILDVLCRCLHDFPDHRRLNEMCMMLVDCFCMSIRAGRDDSAMQLFDDAGAEALLHRNMRRHRTSSRIMNNALCALATLNHARPGRTCMHAATAAAVLVVLVSHITDAVAVSNAIHALLSVMPSLIIPITGSGGSTVPPPQTDTPVILNGAAVIPLAVAGVRCMPCTLVGKTTCVRLFHLLILLCYHDASNVAHVVQCNALQVLVEKFKDSVVEGVAAYTPLDTEWQDYRARLEILVVAGVPLH